MTPKAGNVTSGRSCSRSSQNRRRFRGDDVGDLEHVTERLTGLDRLRGLAVGLMVLDHALAVFAPAAGLPVRMTLTRASLPLFGLVAGSLGPHRLGRLGRVALAGVVAGLVAPEAIARPDILVLLAWALVVASVALDAPRTWWPVLIVAVLQPTTWPLGWPGYEPGLVIALVMLGQLAGRSRLAAVGDRLPGWVAWAGRWPVTVYLGHLVLLRLVELVV